MDEEIKTTELERHFGEGDMFEIDGEKIKLKPLTLKYLPHLYKIYKAFMGATEDASKIFDKLNDETMASVETLIRETLKKSCPDKTEEWVEEVGLKYSLVLLMKIMELNSAGTDMESVKKQKILDRLGKK